MANLKASELAGLRIRQARQQRDWTAKELADQCAAAGAPQITPTVITNLETRRRKTREITLDEVLVLAHVLDVPPLQLMVPQNADEELEVIPGGRLDALAAADWIVGDPAPIGLDVIGAPAASAAGPLERWQERLVRTVGREVLRHRRQRRLSAPQLADRTAELGMPVSRTVLAEVEAGERDTVTVAEVLVLAAALGVAPTELISPVGFDEQIEMLPGRMVDPLEAAKWVYGERVLNVTGSAIVLRSPRTDDMREDSSLLLAEEHEVVVGDVREGEAEVLRRARDLDAARAGVSGAHAAATDAAEHDGDLETAAALMAETERRQQIADAAEVQLASAMSNAAMYRRVAVLQLGSVRAEMRRRGMLLPDLPPSLKGIDDTADQVEVGVADGEG
jgi:transcriptional regulator with XRE-family HTH domain